MKLLAQFGKVDNPFDRIGGPASLKDSTQGQGLDSILNALLKTTILFAGFNVLYKLIVAGNTLLGDGGDPKKVQQAWEKIYVSLIGLLVVAGSLVLAGIFGYLIYGDATALINPQIFKPQ